MKKILFLLLLCAASLVRAQFDPQMGQYMYLGNAYNPAAVGDGDLMRAAAMHRMQNVGIQNAPMTTWVTFCSPFVIGKTKHGAGVRFLNDRFGLFSNQAFYVQYAYRQPLGNGVLSVGVDLGFINVGFRGDSVSLPSVGDAASGEGYFQPNDPHIPTAEVSGMGFDMGLGLWYTTPTWWVGASYAHVTNPTISWAAANSVGQEYELKMVGTLYLTGGYRYRLKDYADWVLRPSAIVATDFYGWDVNLTMMAEYKDRYRFGLGYRVASSVNILLGIDIISGLQLGYTCEIATNSLMRESFGSHELYLAYGFDILKPKRSNRYKSVRFL